MGVGVVVVVGVGVGAWARSWAWAWGVGRVGVGVGSPQCHYHRVECTIEASVCVTLEHTEKTRVFKCVFEHKPTYEQNTSVVLVVARRVVQ